LKLLHLALQVALHFFFIALRTPLPIGQPTPLLGKQFLESENSHPPQRILFHARNCTNPTKVGFDEEFPLRACNSLKRKSKIFLNRLRRDHFQSLCR
jgi:hypothetical protein